MKMTPAIVIIGSIMAFWASMSVMVIMPAITLKVEPSEIWRPMTAEEQEGYRLYVRNGCSYCHSQFIRVMDWDLGAERIAQAGDYVDRGPDLMGSKRTGPDLSQEGGEHPDDWHLAHFTNPRNTSPISVMPSFAFLGADSIRKLTAFVQFEGMLMADQRVERQRHWKEAALQTYGKDLDSHVQWLHAMVPEVWRPMPNPYPALEADLARGRKIYQQFCIGCHGPVGDGRGQAAGFLNPMPLNFTVLRRHLVDNRYIGGLLYYQIMNGITGTAMPYFKKSLESEKIWDVANYLAVSFIGYSDANIEPTGIDASYEPRWQNRFQAPDGQGLSDERDSVGR
ncbi:MAG: cbb3-type cytochrome c oxidase subunit II [Desulfobulbaceae bacterium]|nr:cbb3-type cytochrome c oxidase subunit II [Desulfobulbaceae bacterium]